MENKNGWITEFIKRCTRCKYRKFKGNVEPCKSCDDELSNFKETEKEVEVMDDLDKVLEFISTNYDRFPMALSMELREYIRQLKKEKATGEMAKSK